MQQESKIILDSIVELSPIGCDTAYTGYGGSLSAYVKGMNKLTTELLDRICLLEEQLCLLQHTSVKYASALMLLFTYIEAIEACAQLPELDLKEKISIYVLGLTALENSLRLINHNKRYPVQLSQNTIDPLARIIQIKLYLKSRLAEIDANQEKRIQKVKSIEIMVDGSAKLLADILNELSSRPIEVLPNDAAIFFLSKDGTLLEAGTEKSGYFLLAIDISRLRQYGFGPKGAGLYRFIGQEENITGVLIVRPKCNPSGKPIKLRREKTFSAKEVSEIIGSPPPIETQFPNKEKQLIIVKVGMSFGNLLKLFRAHRPKTASVLKEPDVAQSA